MVSVREKGTRLTAHGISWLVGLAATGIRVLPLKPSPCIFTHGICAIQKEKGSIHPKAIGWDCAAISSWTPHKMTRSEKQKNAGNNGNGRGCTKTTSDNQLPSKTYTHGAVLCKWYAYWWRGDELVGADTPGKIFVWKHLICDSSSDLSSEKEQHGVYG